MNKTIEELEKELNEKIKLKKTDIGSIEAAYITSEDDMKLYVDYWKHRSTACCAASYSEELFRADFRGPDWYFIHGDSSDAFHNGGFWFETLTEKKQKFKAWCKRFESETPRCSIWDIYYSKPPALKKRTWSASIRYHSSEFEPPISESGINAFYMGGPNGPCKATIRATTEEDAIAIAQKEYERRRKEA